ncbi:phage protein [Streptococcus pneumoniae]|nr:phage protein [Streptococcus pneumoniae]VIW70170.1 phage protein [Streptococcus pneumoniae]VIZ11002.1 phage protein [Streptococcus pneumoniae]VJK70841.1 phage protein [Streptococcus pneumoniae]VMH70510.1 phage protein [Streptococcus pneumoniae]
MNIIAIIIIVIFVGGVIGAVIDNQKKSPEQRERELEAFRENQEKKKQEKKQEKKQNIITCPNCKSKDVTFLQQDKKAFSVGKAVGGAVLTGGVGALAGFAGKKGNKQWHCQNCGNFFETK